MISNMVWLDRCERRTYLKEIFIGSVDWIDSDIQSLSGASFIVAHFTDLKKGGAYSPDDKDRIIKRIEAFKKALKDVLVMEGTAPVIVVYSGDSDSTDNANRIPNWVASCIHDSSSVKPLLGVLQTLEGVNRIKNFLEGGASKEALAKKEQVIRDETDVALAIELVTEAVAWLRVTRRTQPPDELKEFRTRLSNKFGEYGEQLQVLADKINVKIDVDVKDCVNRKVTEKETERVAAWQKAGMLSNTGENKP